MRRRSCQALPQEDPLATLEIDTRELEVARDLDETVTLVQSAPLRTKSASKRCTRADPITRSSLQATHHFTVEPASARASVLAILDCTSRASCP